MKTWGISFKICQASSIQTDYIVKVLKTSLIFKIHISGFFVWTGREIEGGGSIGHIMTMHLYSKESSKVTTGTCN